MKKVTYTRSNQHHLILFLLLFILCAASVASARYEEPIIADHTRTDITAIPEAAINQAKADLHIAYGHSSHGQQLTTGMTGLVAFANGGGKGLSLPTDIFAWNEGGTGGALDLQDQPFSGANDLGSPTRTAWEASTRTYLAAHPETNVVIWSWCDQVGYSSVEDIDLYLSLMNGLEMDFPDVHFVYMTGHLNGGGETGILNTRNEQIRAYCRANNKILYDFADIESYDPDEAYFLDKKANDNCDYDSDGNGGIDANWAINWQNAHTVDADWYDCASAHSQALNANLKAYAAWWLWVTLAGWDDPASIELVSGLMATGVEGGVKLEWEIEADEPIAGFQLRRDPVGGGYHVYVPSGQLLPPSTRSYVDVDVEPGTSYYYSLIITKPDGTEIVSPKTLVHTPSRSIELNQNHPNPFNPLTTISFVLPEREKVNLSIYDAKGGLIKTLVDEPLSDGYNEYVWDARDNKGNPVSSGVFFYRLSAGNQTLTKKMIVLK